MRAGELRHRVTIQKPVTARNSAGEETISWSDDVTVWAAVWPLKGTEFFAAQQLQSEVTHKVRIRHRTLSTGGDIGAKCRVIFGTRTFYVESAINPDERCVMLEMMCKETS